MRIAARLGIACWLFVLAAPSAVCAQDRVGLVLDQTGLPLPGVRIEIHRGTEVVHSLTTENDGTFVLPADTESSDVMEAVLDGFQTARVRPDDIRRIVLMLAGTNEVTEVVASVLTSSGAAMEHVGSTMSAPLAQRLPTPRPRILQSLPLLPAVVRGRDGQLSIGGTRPHESSLWIDGFDVTDPVTGTTALDLPVESVKGMAVLRDPISAAFSGVLGSLASIETTTGSDSFEGGVQGFIPRPRLSRLGFGHIEAFFPRAYAGGQLGRHARFFTSAEFNFERVPVAGVTTRSGNPATGATGVTTFARIDFQLSPRHTLTLEGLFAPFDQVNPGLSPLRAPAAAVDVRSRDQFGGVVDRVVIGRRDLVTFRVGYVAHGTAFEGSGEGPALLTPEGWQQNWFSSVDHWGTRQTASVAWDHSGIEAVGVHTVTIFGDYRRRAMTVTQSHRSILIEDDDARLTRQIDFAPSVALAAHEQFGGLGLRDLWNVNARFQVDLGLRLDWTDVGMRATSSPRLGVRYFLDAAERTTVKASAGRFVGRAPLGALVFGQLPARTDTTFDPATGQNIRATTYQMAGVGDLPLPYANGVALEIEHKFTPALEGQVSVRERRGYHLPTVNFTPDVPIVRLDDSGTSVYRELQVSIRRTWRDDAQLFVSYVRASSRGDVNDFGTLFTSLDAPLLEPGGQAPTATDVPHRLRAWATFGLLRRVVLSPSVDWRTGFPYTDQDLYRHNFGLLNGQRLPTFFEVDLTTFKTFDIGARRADLGLQLFNVTAHHNPRDIFSVWGSARYGEPTASFGITVAGYMQLHW